MVIDDHFRTCVVLGGRGFIGRSLVLRLLKLGNWIVRITDSAQSLQLDPSEQNSLLSEALSTGRALYFHVDVRNKPQIIKAIEGSSVVFYTEAANSYKHDFYHCYMIIVPGAKNVINACRECKVKRLIYNSSADVVFDGSHDIRNGDESLPYPWKFEDMLSDLTAQAEALVLFANDIDGLLTCALRPSNVFGPGDSLLVPFLVNKAKSGWTKFIIGSGENMSDFTYVENVAHAHICAEEALGSQMVSVSGKAFFITNLEPVKFSEFVSHILEGLGYQSPMIKLPARMVWYIVLLVKWMHAKIDSRILNNSAYVDNIVQLASRTRTFNCSAAKKHIGYSPVVSLEEGVVLTIDSFSHLAQDSSFVRYGDFDEQSKVEKLLGSGKVADILLWRDEKKTFTYFLALVLLYYWFFLCGRTFVSSAATLLLLITIILSGYSILPSKIFGFTIQRISLSCFEISEVDMRNSITTIACMWNNVVRVTRLLAQGDDWNIFFKVAVSLYFLKLVFSHSLTVAMGVALVLAFTSFFVYEQYEEEIDGIVKFLFNSMKVTMGLLMRNLPVSVASILRNCQILHEEKGPVELKHQQ
uniref:Reticulon-like protein n=1 Tax=Davidia involucrata TaxID=16924 RepID=A0A5B6ZX06_DAVIN